MHNEWRAHIDEKRVKKLLGLRVGPFPKIVVLSSDDALRLCGVTPTDDELGVMLARIETSPDSEPSYQVVLLGTVFENPNKLRSALLAGFRLWWQSASPKHVIQIKRDSEFRIYFWPFLFLFLAAFVLFKTVFVVEAPRDLLNFFVLVLAAALTLIFPIGSRRNATDKELLEEDVRGFVLTKSLNRTWHKAIKISSSQNQKGG